MVRTSTGLPETYHTKRAVTATDWCFGEISVVITFRQTVDTARQHVFRLSLVIAECLAVLRVPTTAFANEHVRVQHARARKVECIKCGSVLVARTFPHGVLADTWSGENRTVPKAA